MLEQDDLTLVAGGVINGQPARIQDGAQEQVCLSLNCATCGQRVGNISMVQPNQSIGQDLLLVASVQGVDRVDPKPVRTRLVRVAIRDGASLLADCTAHGRVAAPMGRVIARFQHWAASGASRRGRMELAPEGFPVGHDLDRSSLMTLEEAKAWLEDKQRVQRHAEKGER